MVFKKVKTVMEYSLKCSPQLVFKYLSTPSGLQDWFANKVDIYQNKYTFSWTENDIEIAEKIFSDNLTTIRFRWVESLPSEYFEFKIYISEISNETVLIITDFAEPNNTAELIELWNYYVKKLIHRIGC